MSPIVRQIGFTPIKSTKFHWINNPAWPVTIDYRGIKYDRRWVIAENGMFVAQRESSGMGIEVRSLCEITSEIFGRELIVQAPGMKELHLPLEGIPGQDQLVQVWKNKKLRAIDQGLEAEKWFTTFLSRERKGRYQLMRMSDTCQRQTKIGEALLGFQDAFPFMMVSDVSLANLNLKLTSIGQPAVPMDRFRPNIVLSYSTKFEDATFAHFEDKLRLFKIGGVGGVRFEGKTLCSRCTVVNTNQKTAVRSTEPLRTLATYRRGSDLGIEGEGANKVYFGLNCNHLNLGFIRVNDEVQVEQIG